MRKIFFLLLLIVTLYNCKPTAAKKEINVIPAGNSSTSTIKFYSRTVKDSFLISVNLPKGYTRDAAQKYPVIYLLDANVYFDIMAATFNRYSEVGLLPPAILVGIGYKDFQTMDSLRNRDYTYPVAIPEYEMSISGKADLFYSFIKTELVPEIDKQFSPDKNKRALMGHSLSGYFVLYALQQQLHEKDSMFYSYIAASPSADYNHNYLVKELEAMDSYSGSKAKVYVTYGGNEDEEEADENNKDALKSDAVILSLAKSLKEKNRMDYYGEVYSNLSHMDTPLLSFVKGLQWTFMNESGQ